MAYPPAAPVRLVPPDRDRVVVFERRKELAPRGKAVLRAWKRAHVPFSIALLATMLAHIAIALQVL